MDKNNKISKDLEDLENLYKKKTISEDGYEGGFDLSLYINIQSWIKRIQSETNYVKIGI